MQRIDVATAANALPTPSAPGTPGYFTKGNPGLGVPATVLDQDWHNMVQEELINLVVAGGGTPDKTDYTQVATAVQALIAAAVGQAQGGQMTLSGGTLTFAPFKGGLLSIGTTNRTIPSGGFTISSSGASNNTTYYIYAKWTGSPGAMSGEYSATAPTLDAATGKMVKTGDSTKTFIGWAATNGSGTWRLARSYYNDTSTVSGPQAVLVFDGKSGGSAIYTEGDISFSRTSAGKYTITVNMADANYGVIATAQADTGTDTIVIQEETGTSKTTTQVKLTAYVNTSTPTLVDAKVVTVAVFGKRLGD